MIDLNGRTARNQKCTICRSQPIKRTGELVGKIVGVTAKTGHTSPESGIIYKCNNKECSQVCKIPNSMIESNEDLYLLPKED